MYVALGLLLIAISAEVGATTALPHAQGFTNPVWTTIVLAGYIFSIWLLTIVVKTIPVSVTYATWAGLGTAAIAVVGVAFLNESINPLKVIAIMCIVGGVVLLNFQRVH